MAAQLSRRDFLQATGLAAAGSFLAACGPKGGGPATPPTQAPGTAGDAPTPKPAQVEGIEMQWWTGWTGAFINAWEELGQTDEFKEIVGPHKLVVRTNNSEALLTATAAGTPPDLAGNGLFYLDYMSRGVLTPIAEYVNQSSIIKKEDYIESSWDGGFYKGVQYGVPCNEGFVRYGFCYNTNMVEEAGLDPDAPPETWQEMLEWHEALTKFDDAGNLLQIGLDPYDSIGGSLNPIDGFFPGDSWGMEPYFDDASGEFRFDNEKMADVFDTFAEFYRIIGPDKMAGFRAVEGQGNWGASYFSQVQALVVDGYWHCGWTNDADPELAKASRYSWAPVTEDRRGTKMQYVGGHVLVLFKDAKHNDEAFKVIEFAQTDLACSTVYDANGFLPARPSFIEKADPSRHPGLDFYFASVDEATEWAPFIPCVIANFAQDQFMQLGEAVYRDEMTGQQAAAEMQRRCTEEWQKSGL